MCKSAMYGAPSTVILKEQSWLKKSSRAHNATTDSGVGLPVLGADYGPPTSSMTLRNLLNLFRLWVSHL